jgi:dethiobiotin synthetase
VRGLLVTATDTGVGKTILSAALLASIAADGESVRAYKPVVTGLDERLHTGDAGAWPPDHELLASAAGMDAAEVASLRFGPAVSPVLAADLAGERIDPARLLADARTAAGDGEPRTLIVEGVGGLLTPLADGHSVCDFAAALGLPVLIAARPCLGTINHTLLSLQAARAAALDVRAVVLTPWPEQPSLLERSNRETIARLGAVDVEGLSRARSADRAELARAGAGLPWRRWLG